MNNNNNNNNNNTNFWISYADLMAGLLFVFILLVGAIIVKYSLLESKAKLLEQAFIEEKITLQKNKNKLDEKSKLFLNTIDLLNQTKNKLNILILDKEALEEKLLKQNQYIVLKNEEIEKYILLEIDYKLKLEHQNFNSIILKQNINKIKNTLQTKSIKIDELFQNILEKEKKILLFKNIEEKNNTKIINLNNKINITKEKINNLTGIKIQVIKLLKKSLGQDIQIDPINGSIRLSSNILFDEGKSDLKENSKQVLKQGIYSYLNTILENENINKHIDKITIEGHTNSKGSFLYNLNLSQKRAYSVMEFLFSMNFEKKAKLKKLLLASGRSFLDPILDQNGKEDINKSRRIEIKFNLKNKESIKEIEVILNNGIF